MRPFVDQGQAIGVVQLFQPADCSMLWAELRDLKIKCGGAVLRIDLFRNQAERLQNTLGIRLQIV